MTHDNLRALLSQVLGTEFKYALLSLGIYTKETNDQMPGPGVTNLRDALTHVRKVFSEQDLDVQLEQLCCAREHIRRAAVETFQELFEQRYHYFYKEYQKYRYHCQPYEAPLSYAGSVDHEHIMDEFERLKSVFKTCRTAKDGGDWNHNIIEFRTACKEIRALGTLVSEAFAKYSSSGGDLSALHHSHTA